MGGWEHGRVGAWEGLGWEHGWVGAWEGGSMGGWGQGGSMGSGAWVGAWEAGVGGAWGCIITPCSCHHKDVVVPE